MQNLVVWDLKSPRSMFPDKCLITKGEEGHWYMMGVWVKTLKRTLEIDTVMEDSNIWPPYKVSKEETLAS